MPKAEECRCSHQKENPRNEKVLALRDKHIQSPRDCIVTIISQILPTLSGMQAVAGKEFGGISFEDDQDWAFCFHLEPCRSGRSSGMSPVQPAAMALRR